MVNRFNVALLLFDSMSIELTFPEFHLETEAKADFPSACI